MPDDEEGSVTRWLAPLKAGDEAAVQPLWERYFDALVRLARKKLRAVGYPYSDEGEDVALSAFHSFCGAVRRDRFPRLDDRDDLWRVLVHVTVGKILDLRQRHSALKRGGGRFTLEADLRPPRDGEGASVLDQIVGAEPSPAFAAQVAEECERLLAMLGDPDLREIALMKLACLTNEEIAARLDRSLSWVTLRLKSIRKRWEAEVP